MTTMMKLRSSKNQIANVNQIAKVNKIIKRRRRTPVKKNEKIHSNLIKMVERYNDDLKIFKMLVDFKNQMNIEVKRKDEMEKINVVNFDTMSFVCPELEYWNVQF